MRSQKLFIEARLKAYIEEHMYVAEDNKIVRNYLYLKVMIKSSVSTS